MAVLPIRIYPDPVLLKKAKPVQAVTPEIRKLVTDMTDTLYDAPGIGLAAPQVGVSLRVIVADPSSRDHTSELQALINPVILWAEGEETLEEGCLSLPNITEEVTRPARIRVSAWDRDGKDLQFETDGLLARVIQHEIDHLEGIVILDHLGKAKRDLLKKKLIKKQKELAEARM
ncbi:MAG TPA: peptide deformylase [bacterium]|nr:peptide deformylase [bacterium]